MSGLNQEVDVLGKVFHFQTEQSGGAIRTEVFVGGKVVATREVELSEADRRDDDTLRARLKDHHQQTLATFVKRARTYQERGESEASGELPAAQVPPASVPAAQVPPASVPAAQVSARPAAMSHLPESSGTINLAPPGDGDPEIEATLRVRRFFARFRKLTDPETSPPSQGERLEKAAQAFAWMIQSPLFTEIRVDEQARCHLLAEQINSWLAGRRDPNEATQIWAEIVTFNNYLAEVNHRAELMSYDLQLVVWVIDMVNREGMTPEVFEQLETLYGRHAKLDSLIDQPDSVSAMVWVAHLRSVLMLL